MCAKKAKIFGCGPGLLGALAGQACPRWGIVLKLLGLFS
jgi:hypothetical protein